MGTNDSQRQRVPRTIGTAAQLEGQALLQVASPNAGGIEVLDMPQGNLQFFKLDFVLGGNGFQQLFKRTGEITVIIQGLNHETHQTAIPLTQLRQAHLPRQVIAQARAGSVAILTIRIIIVIASGAAIATRIARPAILFLTRRQRLQRVRNIASILTRTRILGGALTFF